MLERELKAACDLAVKGGRILLDSRGNSMVTGIKSDQSIITDADRKASEFLTSELAKGFPSYGLLDEENPQPDTRYKHELCWVTDPLESTISYSLGMDTFGILIGLMKKFRPVLGVSYRPATGELVYAVIGEGTYQISLAGKKALHVSLSDSVDVLVSRFRNSTELDAMLQRIGQARVRQMPSSFKAIEVAKGNATLFLSAPSKTMNLWDLCAPQIILEEAGGRMTDVSGSPIDYSGNLAVEKGVIASNGIIHDYVIGRLRDAQVAKK